MFYILPQAVHSCLTVSFGARERNGRVEEVNPPLDLQLLWSKFFIFSCEFKCVIRHLGASSLLLLAPSPLCKFSL